MPPKKTKNLLPDEVENKTKTKTPLKRKRVVSKTEEDEEDDKWNPTQDSLDLPAVNIKKFERYNKEKAWQLRSIPHHLLPSFNIFKNNNIHDVRADLLMRIHLPRSIFVNSKFSDDVDMCYRRTANLATYMHRTKKVLSAYKSAKKNNKQIRKDESKGIFCNTLIDYAQRREMNPDKYFARDYDFYYTGGNLSVNRSNNQVAHVGGNNMDSLFLSELNVEENGINTQHLAIIDFSKQDKEESEIFEVQWSLASSDLLFLRQKHCVSIRKYENDTFKLVRNFKSNDVPLISFTPDAFSPNIITISDLQHKVRVCDIEQNKPLHQFRMMPKDQIKPAMNWNMIRALDSHVFIYAACKKLSIIDIRLPESEWQSNYCGYIEEDVCSNFCSLALSNFDNLLYAGANHKAYCLDRRYMNKNIESRNSTVTRWTHQMSSFPLMMATNRYEDSEYIVLQSPMNSDMRICENLQFLQEADSSPKRKSKKSCTELARKYLYKSPCLPYMPPSLENLFEEARLNGKCLKQNTGMMKRVVSCVCGLSFAGENSNPYILTATSLGDVFARQMSKPEDTESKLNSSDVMQEFEDNILRSVRKAPLNTTAVCNLAGMSKVFRCPLLSDNKPVDDTLVAAKQQKRKYMGRWQKSIYHLSKYKDALASDLLSAWSFDIEEEKGINLKMFSSTQMGESKVTSWLEQAPDIISSTMINMTSIPTDILNASNVTFGETSFDYSLLENNTQTELDQTETQQPVVAKPKVAKKKKSKYVKGF